MTRPEDENPVPQPPSGREVEQDRFPPFNDPAFSPERGSPPETDPAAPAVHPPKDTQYQGHPDFSQDAAKNDPPPRRRHNVTEK